MPSFGENLDYIKTLFPEPEGKSPIVSYLEGEGEAAGRRAGTGARAGLARSGFGGSTFTEPIATQAATIAKQPFVGQAASAASQEAQNRWRNILGFMNSLQNQQKIDSSKELQEQKSQNALINALISGGGKAILGGVSPVLDFFGGFLPKPSDAPGAVTSGFLPNYNPVGGS